MTKSALSPLICTQCGGEVELDSNQQFGFCKYCGTKLQNTNYQVIKGEVKLEISEFVEKFLANARRAKNKEDWEEVEKYYNLVEQNEPDNIEAIFFSSYGKCRLSLVETDIYKRTQKFNVLCNSISVIYDNWKIKDIEKNLDTLNEITNAIVALPYTSFTYNTITYPNGLIEDNASNTFKLFTRVFESYIDTMEQIIEKTENSRVSKEILFYLNAILVYVITSMKATNTTRSILKKQTKKLDNIYTKMEEYNPTYKRPKKKLFKISEPFTLAYVITSVVILILLLVAII